MTTPATASSLREATSPEALTRARRRLLTAHPDPTRANTPTPGSLTDEQIRVLAAHDWAPPRIGALDMNTIATADPITRALLVESVRETLERRLGAERPHGTYDDTRARHDAFRRGVTDDYDHGNHHLARATIPVADPGLVTCAGLSSLGLPDTDATIIDELAQASAPNPIASVLADAALLDLDRYATGADLRYSRVGTALILAAPNEQRPADAIDTVAAAAIGAGARLTDVTTQYIDDEKALASIGIDPWAIRPSDEPTGQADRILYVGRDGARPCQSGPRPRRRTRLAARRLRPQTQRHAHRPVRKRRPVRRRALVGDAQWRRRRVPVAARLLPRHPHRRENPRLNPRPHPHRPTRPGRARRRHNRAHARLAALPRRRAYTRRNHGHRRCVLQRLLRRALRVRARRRHLRRAQPTPTPRPAQRRPVLRVAILLSECVGALHAAGLEPSLGIAHAPTDKRPSLVLDLMAQFRPLLVDRTVMALLRTRKLRPEHGVVEAEAGRVWLGADGKKILVDACEAACQRSFTGALPGYSGSWRRHIAHSAQMVARAIVEPDYPWSGGAWR